jgi:hypothetical protein
MASKGPKINKEDTVGKRKHVTLTIPHDLEIIRRLVFDSVPIKNAIHYKHVLMWLVIPLVVIK